MSLGPFQLLIISLVIVVLFGRGRISEMMGDFGKGVRSFRRGLNDDGNGAAMRVEGPDANPIAEPMPAADKSAG